MCVVSRVIAVGARDEEVSLEHLQSIATSHDFVVALDGTMENRAFQVNAFPLTLPLLCGRK